MNVKSAIKKAMSGLVASLPESWILNYIVLESKPDLSDNTRAVFDEMIRRGLNKKYKFIWLVSDRKHTIPNVKNVRFVSDKGILKYWYKFFCKCGICCNGKLYSHRKGQFSMYLCHSITIKANPVDMKPFSNKIDWFLASSDGIKDFFARELRAHPSKGVSLGFPRNDAFSAPALDLHPYFDVDFEKVVVWYPTFRQNPGDISASDSNIALPIIHDAAKAIELNEFAKANKILIVLKPHFAQDLDYMKDMKLDHIRFIYDDFFFEHGIQSYDFVAGCDALLTDYSSIYFDFMLANKPIGLIWEDVEDYKKRPGFAQGVEELMDGGVKIYTLDELLDFLRDVADNRDTLKQNRDSVCALVHYAADGKSSARVADFIIEKAKL